MDEQTKHIVAAILTAGYCANRPGKSGVGIRQMLESGGANIVMTTGEIVATYRQMLVELDAPPAGSAKRSKGK